MCLGLLFHFMLLFTRLLLLWAITEPVVNLPSFETVVTVEQKTSGDEQRLLRYILRTYEKHVRPVYNASDIVSVSIGLTLTHIFNIDEKSQVLSLNVWLAQLWNDQRLSWNISEFANLTQLTVPKKFLWTPDIVLFNNAEDYSQGMVQTNAAVYSDGTVYWLPPVKFRSTCKLNMQFFPFDRQRCTLRFRSWIYDGSQISITNKSENVDLSDFNEHGEWDLIQVEQLLTTEYYTKEKDTPFPEIVFVLHLQRRTLFYMYNILIPCVMLSLLTMMQFWLPCESGEKVTLGLTVVLAYSVFNFNIAESMPETSDVIPLVAVYIMCIMAISCMAVCFSVMVLKVRHGGERQQKVPYWLHYIADGILGPIFCFPTKAAKKVRSSNEQNASINRAFHALSTYIVGVAADQNQEVSRRTDAPKRSDSKSNISVKTLGAEAAKLVSVHQKKIRLPSMQKRFSFPRPADLASRSSFHEKLRRNTKSSSAGLSAGLSGFSTISAKRSINLDALDDALANSRLRNIIKRTAVLMSRFEQENSHDDTVAEWQRVSRILDQFFFWMVFALTTASTLALFIAGLAHQQNKKLRSVEDHWDNIMNKTIN